MKILAIAALAAAFVSGPAWATDIMSAVKHYELETAAASTLGPPNGVPTTDGISHLYVVSEVTGFIAVQPTPFVATAASTHVYMPAGEPLVIKSRGSQAIRVLMGTKPGTVFITEMSE